ncbi:MAG TPA: c-type cytochrome [Steroidobacter sp.]|uniref:c-type cytochrome n=1 Tax=Steroidobacter sp. TaxID=1978227 RepID=UPI002ED9FB0B
MTSMMSSANRLALALWPTLWLALPARAADSPPAAFNNHCRTCHSVKEGDNRLGPSLHQVHGRKAGSVAGYANYSQAMKSAGITWDEATLDKFIEDPEQVIPNNNMKPYKGIPDAAVREQIVAYLKSQSTAE